MGAYFFISRRKHTLLIIRKQLEINAILEYTWSSYQNGLVARAGEYHIDWEKPVLAICVVITSILPSDKLHLLYAEGAP
jgi:hypothetical protein